LKAILRVYKWGETLEREFSSVEEAVGFAERMYKRRPDLIFEPHLDSADSCVVGVLDVETENARELEHFGNRNNPVVKSSLFLDEMG
jgi:hypothetical protein